MCVLDRGSIYVIIIVQASENVKPETKIILLEVFIIDKIKVSDYEEVLAVVGKYTEGCKVGKSDIMKPAFTANALMYGYLNGEYYNGSIEALYGAVDAFGAAPDTLARVDVLAIEGTAASVRVTLENWHGLSFTDFHNLIKEDGQWKIVAKVFHQYN